MIIDMNATIQRVQRLAQDALRQYRHDTLRHGGEPVYPSWADDVLALCRLAEQSISGQAGSAILPTGTEAPMPCTESDRDAIQDASPAGYLVAGAFFAARDRTEAEQLASRAGCPLQALYTRPGLPASGQAAPMAPGDARLPIIGGILGRIRPRRRT